MRIESNGIFFFSPKEYKELKYQYLNKSKYRKFIKRLNERKIEEEVINKAEGLQLPFGLGIIKIAKEYKKESPFIYNNQVAKKTINNHTLGFVFRIILLKNNFKLPYSTKYKIKNKVGVPEKAHYITYMFKPVRELKRKFAKIIFSGNYINYDNYEHFERNSKQC